MSETRTFHRKPLQAVQLVEGMGRYVGSHGEPVVRTSDTTHADSPRWGDWVVWFPEDAEDGEQHYPRVVRAADFERLIAERSEPAAASVPLSATTLLTVQAHEPHSAGAIELIARVVEDELNGLGLGDFTVTLAAPAVSREASVPQGGEFTAAEVTTLADYIDASGMEACEPFRDDAVKYLRAYARALSSVPGERT
jgi:hypothetical protein